MLRESVKESVERDYVRENSELRERVRELEWKLADIRRAAQIFHELATEPAEVRE